MFNRELSFYSIVKEHEVLASFVRTELSLNAPRTKRVPLVSVCLGKLVELIGIEPMTPGLQSRCSPS
jgi:hypothetical protein